MPSLSLVRDGTHPLAVGPGNPGLFPGQADQTGSAGGCQKTWARPIDRLAGQPERRQPNRRSGRDPGPDPTPVPPQNGGSRAGSTIHILPAEYLPVLASWLAPLFARRLPCYACPQARQQLSLMLDGLAGIGVPSGAISEVR